jgi:hypothetical protein
MAERRIQSEQAQAAWKMLRTLADEYGLTPMEQSFLLQTVGAVGLRHSMQSGEIEWIAGPQKLRLSIDEDRVVVDEVANLPLALSPDITEEEADAAYNLAERILDLHEMPEEERTGLYHALPCLAFHSLQERYLQWRVSPPFEAIAPAPPKPGKRR